MKSFGRVLCALGGELALCVLGGAGVADNMVFMSLGSHRELLEGHADVAEGLL
jgi:hypothetical protein